jgi:hypothetical protein
MTDRLLTTREVAACHGRLSCARSVQVRTVHEYAPAHVRHAHAAVLPQYGIPVTTVRAMMGHANPAFTLACYGRDPRDEQTMVADVLARAAAATS